MGLAISIPGVTLRLHPRLLTSCRSAARVTTVPDAITAMRRRPAAIAENLVYVQVAVVGMPHAAAP